MSVMDPTSTPVLEEETSSGGSEMPQPAKNMAAASAGSPDDELFADLWAYVDWSACFGELEE